jgi:hypothetical protein|tara:strand:- start:111 stop:338 length:228 start_codon:yes stop_codon:yes gene_type:complete
MAKRGRPKSKPIPKWNPRYSKISVRVALQNALTDGGAYDPTREHKRIIDKVLAECDQKVLDGQKIIDSESAFENE